MDLKWLSEAMPSNPVAEGARLRQSTISAMSGYSELLQAIALGQIFSEPIDLSFAAWFSLQQAV